MSNLEVLQSRRKGNNYAYITVAQAYLHMAHTPIAKPYSNKCWALNKHHPLISITILGAHI